jgi:hypothetical protein
MIMIGLKALYELPALVFIYNMAPIFWTCILYECCFK